jgi:hypothetical protein
MLFDRIMNYIRQHKILLTRLLFISLIILGTILIYSNLTDYLVLLFIFILVFAIKENTEFSFTSNSIFIKKYYFWCIIEKKYCIHYNEIQKIRKKNYDFEINENYWTTADNIFSIFFVELFSENIKYYNTIIEYLEKEKNVSIEISLNSSDYDKLESYKTHAHNKKLVTVLVDLEK